jgi:hypothetical protein
MMPTLPAANGVQNARTAYRLSPHAEQLFDRARRIRCVECTVAVCRHLPLVGASGNGLQPLVQVQGGIDASGQHRS